MQITRAKVINLWTYMLLRYDTKIIPKPTDPKMKRMRRLVSILGIMSSAEFDRYNMTLGKSIYLMEPIGKPGSVDGYCDRIETCVHEHIHAVDGVNYIKYLLSKSYRARVETAAYKSNLIMCFVMTGGTYAPGYMAAKLEGYKCTRAQIARAEQEYTRLVSGLNAGKLGEILASDKTHPVIKAAVHYLWTVAR